MLHTEEPLLNESLAIDSLRMHSHPCSIYSNAEELKKQFVPFLRAGLALGEKCVYFIDENDISFVVESMKSDDFDPKPFIQSKQLEIIHTKDAHLYGGHFAEDKMLAYWNQAIDQAKKEGFAGLRAAVEMTWALSGKPGCEILAPYESRLTQLMQEKDASVICMYSRQRFSPEKIKAIIHAHPTVITHDIVLENPACPPPEKFIEGSTDLDVQATLDNLELIRELRRVKRELQERIQNEATFRLAVSSIKDYAIFMLDAHGNIRSWNDGARRIKGYSADEIIGKHFSIFYPTEVRDRKHPEKELEIATEKGRYEEEGWRIRKDGSQFWANVVITPLYENGTLVGFAKITRDLTERKNAERAREVAYRQYVKATEELQQMAYVISHELQEPVSSITSYSKLLVSRYKERLGKDADEFLSLIQNGARMTARLVDDLWTYARVTKPGSSRHEVHTGTLLQTAKDELSKSIATVNAKIMHQSLDTFPIVEANKDQLLYVMKELITNAIKHYKGESSPEIEISVMQERTGWTFHFKDNGPGIDKFFAQQAFGIYQRLDSKPDENGTGMGLPICKKIIEDQHGGRIGYQSIQGEGANFFFWLPMKDSATSSTNIDRHN